MRSFSKSKLVVALTTSATLVASFIAIGPAASSTAPDYSILATQDTIVTRTNPTEDNSARGDLNLKSGIDGNGPGLWRMPYLEFSYEETAFQSGTNGKAELSFFVQRQDMGGEPLTPVTNGTSITGVADIAFQIEVYGISDSGNRVADFRVLNYQSTDNVSTLLPLHRNGISPLLRSTPPGEALLLGTADVPVSTQADPGTRISLSTPELRQFLFEDQDKNVTIFMVRKDNVPGPNLLIHSIESQTCHGPELRNFIGDASNLNYSINYLANSSNVSNLPGNTTVSHLSCAVARAAAAPQKEGDNFIEWNTRADGQGDSFAPNQRISQPGDVVLYAIWESTRNVVAGPVASVIDVNPTTITVDNEIITILGANLHTVTDVYIGGIRVPIFTQSVNRLQVRAPKGLSGLVDLELKSSLNDVLMTKKLNFGGTAAAGTRKATLIVGGFDHNSRKLTKKMKNRIDRWLNKNSDLSTLTCTGFTSLPRRTSDVTLSTNRGVTACNFSKRQRAELETSVSQGIEDPRPGSNVRRVRLVLTR